MHTSGRNSQFCATAALIGALMLSQSVKAASIPTPSSLVTCQPIAVDWKDAPAGDVYLSVIPGGKQSDPALVDLGKYSGSSGSVAWTVNLAAGTEITLKLVDSLGVNSFSSPVKIQAGQDTSCIGQPVVVKSNSLPSSTSAQSSSSLATTTTSGTSTSSVTSTATGTLSTNATLNGTASSTETSSSIAETTSLPGSNITALVSSSTAPFNATGAPSAAFASFQWSGAAIGLSALIYAIVVLA